MCYVLRVMGILDNQRNNKIIITIAALILLALIFWGGRLSHEMYETWTINFS